MAREYNWVVPMSSFNFRAGLAEVVRRITTSPRELTSSEKVQVFCALADEENACIRNDLRDIWRLGNPYRHQMSLMRTAYGTPPAYLYYIPGVGGVHRFGRYGLAIVDEVRNVNCLLRTDVRFDIQNNFIIFRMKISGSSALAEAVTATGNDWFVWYFDRRKQKGKAAAYLELSEFTAPLGCNPQLQYLASPLEFAVLQGLATSLLRELTLQAMAAFQFTPRDNLRIYAWSLRNAPDAGPYRRFYHRAQTRRLKQFYNRNFGLPLDSHYVPLETFATTSAPPMITPRLDVQILSEYFAAQLLEDVDDPMMTESSASSGDEITETESTDEDAPLQTRGGHGLLHTPKQRDTDFDFSAGF